VAVVGCGRWGALIVRDLAELGAAVVTVDRDPAVGADRADPSALRSGEVDAVVVATPAATHAAVVREVAGLGVPVACEKPLTTSVAEAEELVALLGDRLWALHVWRAHPGIEVLARLAAAGDLGEVQGLRTVRAGWTSPRTDVDAAWTLVPHDLTIAIAVLGAIAEPRAALAERHQGRAVGLWALNGGGGDPFHVIEASTRFGDKRREVRVHGGDAVAVLAGPDAPEVRIEAGHDAVAVRRTVPVPAEPALRRQLARFLGHLDGGPPPYASGAEGLEVVRGVARLRALAGLSP
jgi:predicted dehydrogenase